MIVDFFFDFKCPWCFIGLRRLGRAMERNPGVGFQVRFHPYALPPVPPPGGTPIAASLQQLIPDPEARQASVDKITGIGRELGIDFRYDRPLVSCDTLNAHRLVRNTAPDKQWALVDALFRAAFEEARLLDDPAHLAMIAQECGADEREHAESFVRSRRRIKEVEEELARVAMMPIITIPYLVLDERYPVQAAHLPGVAGSCIGNLL